MRKVRPIQAAFYILVFLFGVIYQPNWVYDNFWAKADFYENLPFVIPYQVFITLYCFTSTILTWFFVKGIKRYL